MSESSIADRYPHVWRKRSMRETLLGWLWTAGVAAAAAWSVSALDIEWAFFADAHEQAIDLIERMWPPRWSYLPSVVRPLIETIHIATLGTAIALVLALPLAFLAARNTTMNEFTWAIGRALLVASRSVNTVIWGLVFVAIFGPGPVAGIAAVAARSVGFLAKLAAEAIEEASRGQIEAIESTGASTGQVYLLAILPQVMPVLIGTTVYRWDINVRMATVIGLVGGGGIGFLLQDTINLGRWSQAGTAIWLIALVVCAMDAASAALRERLL